MKKQALKETYKYPSRFGSHKVMVIEDNFDGTVVCEDEYGKYTTKKIVLDNGLADPARCSEKRLSKLFVKTKKEK